MPRPASTPLDPRKSPVQARSTASVDAILEATIQVLLDIGSDRLTTTRVAYRAGVSIGTLYQYFPNKSALLQAVLRQHLEHVTAATEQVCREQRGNPLHTMAIALVAAFLAAKMHHPETSVALYTVSADLNAARIVQELGARSSDSIVAMLRTSPEPLTSDPRLVASVLQGAMAGVSRRLLESPRPAELFDAFRDELTALACTYLQSCSTNTSHRNPAALSASSSTPPATSSAIPVRTSTEIPLRTGAKSPRATATPSRAAGPYHNSLGRSPRTATHGVAKG